MNLLSRKYSSKFNRTDSLQAIHAHLHMVWIISRLLAPWHSYRAISQSSLVALAPARLPWQRHSSADAALSLDTFCPFSHIPRCRLKSNSDQQQSQQFEDYCLEFKSGASIGRHSFVNVLSFHLISFVAINAFWRDLWIPCETAAGFTMTDPRCHPQKPPRRLGSPKPQTKRKCALINAMTN